MLRLVTAMLCIGAAGTSLAADTVIFDPDGSGNSPAVNMNTFQFGAGNSLFQNGIPFTQGAAFQLFFQAQLNSLVNGSSVQITPLGLNATGAVGAVAPFEITLVGSVTENVTNVNNTPARVLYRVAGTQAPGSFIELYYDGSQNANALGGTGYNDGRLILRGVPSPPSPDVGSFNLNNPQATTNPNFDSFSVNDYVTGGTGNTNLTSISGIGATTIAVVVTFVDAAFFVAPGGGNAAHQVHVGDLISLDISHSAPFDKVDPSRKFDGTANTGTGSGAAPAVVPRLGTINGASGPDFQAQSIAAASIRSTNTSPTPTPTPGGSPTPTPTVTPTPTPGGSPTPTPSATPVGLRVVVTANKSQVTEGADAVVTFSARGATTHPALTVHYSVGGNATLNTDYTLSGTPGVVVIPANAASASITLHSIVDTTKEPDGEAAKVFVEAGTGYDVPTQVDAKRVTVLIVDQ